MDRPDKRVKPFQLNIGGDGRHLACVHVLRQPGGARALALASPHLVLPGAGAQPLAHVSAIRPLLRLDHGQRAPGARATRPQVHTNGGCCCCC